MEVDNNIYEDGGENPDPPVEVDVEEPKKELGKNTLIKRFRKSKPVQIFVRMFDSYGGSALDDPQMKEPSFAGACFSLFSKIVFIILLVVAVIKLIEDQAVIGQGNSIQFNFKDDTSQMDVPAMKLHQKNELLFFEKDAPSIQKIEVIDHSVVKGKKYTSSQNSVPTTTAVYKEIILQMGEFDTRISKIKPKNSDNKNTIDVRNVVQERSLHEYLSDTLTGIYVQESGVESTITTNHQVSAYIRLAANELNNLKKCQFQAQLVNAAEFELLSSQLDEEDSIKNLTSVTTTVSTWAGPSFDDSTLTFDEEFNVLRLSKVYGNPARQAFLSQNPSFTTSDLLKPSINNWKLLTSYVNNFKGYADQYQCGENKQWKMASDFAVPIQASETTIQFLAPIFSAADAVTIDPNTGLPVQSSSFDPSNIKPKFCNSNSEYKVPFKLLIGSAHGQEIVTVTAVSGDCKTLTIKRGSPAFDYKKPEKYDDPKVVDGKSVNPVPPSWICDASKYGSGDGCDCNCGAPDIDCIGVGGKSKNCGMDEVCNFRGECMPDVFSTTANLGTLLMGVRDYASNYTVNGKIIPPLIVSNPCHVILKKGQSYNHGYFGRSDNLIKQQCQICPGDVLNNYQPTLDPLDGQYYCNGATVGLLSSKLSIGSNRLNIFPMQIPQSTPKDYFNLTLKIDARTPFPVKNQPTSYVDPKEYSVVFNYNQRNTQSFKVLQADAPTGGTQKLALTSSSATTATSSEVESFLPFMAQGQIPGAISPKSKQVLFLPKSIDVTGLNRKQSLGFSTDTSDLPNNVVIRQGSTNIAAKVVGVKDVQVDGKVETYQMLTLDSPPLVSYGFYLKTDRVYSKGTQDIVVFFEPTTMSIKDSKSFFNDVTNTRMYIYHPNMKIIFDQKVSSITKHFTWNVTKCPIENYNSGDPVCDCSCGQLDPDCFLGFSTPSHFYQNKDAIVRNCPADERVAGCSNHTDTPYQNPTCVSSRDDATWSDERPPPEFIQPLNFTIRLDKPIPEEIPAGSILFSSISNAPLEIERQVNVRVERTNARYRPSTRSRRTPNEDFDSPQAIRLETSLFVSPLRPPYASASICPTMGLAYSDDQVSTYENWELNKDLELNVTCGKFESIEDTCKSANTVTQSSLIRNCTREMPPQRSYKFDVILPVNHKYEAMKDSSGSVLSIVEDPEVKFDYEVIYHFGYDQKVQSVERKFAQNKETSGDVSQHNRVLRFFGSMDYRGSGNGENASYNTSFPASVPFISTYVRLEYDMLRTASLALDNGVDYWPRTQKEIEEVVEKFSQEVISWDFSSVSGSVYEDNPQQYVALEPGYAYTLSALITITPQYDHTFYAYLGTLFFWLEYIVNFYVISDWNVVVSDKSVSRQAILGANANTASVRYQISFASNTQQLFNRRSQTITSLISDIGSAIALLSIGLTLLTYHQKLFNRWSPRFLDWQHHNEQKKLKKQKNKPDQSTPIESFDGLQQVELEEENRTSQSIPMKYSVQEPTSPPQPIIAQSPNIDILSHNDDDEEDALNIPSSSSTNSLSKSVLVSPHGDNTSP